MHVTHFAFDFSFRNQGCYGVDHNNVDGVGAHQHVGDFQRLLTGIGLRHQQVVNIDAKLACVFWIERVLSIDECTGSTQLLGLSDNRKRQRGFTRGFRTVDFNDSASWQATDTEGDIQPE